jgi:hypothetical protein
MCSNSMNSFPFLNGPFPQSLCQSVGLYCAAYYKYAAQSFDFLDLAKNSSFLIRKFVFL